MTELDLSLEEYHDFLKQHPYRRKRFIYRNRSLITAVSYIAAGESSTLLELNTDMPCTISGNNADGFVLTEWRSSDEKR